MKHEIISEILKNIKQKPQLMKKLKVFAIIGVIGLFTFGGLVIWAGISAVSYMTSKTTEVMQSQKTQEQIETLITEARELPRFQAIKCWDKAQSLLAVQPWLERPAVDNLINLKKACLEQKRSCDGPECNQATDLLKTGEGEVI